MKDRILFQNEACMVINKLPGESSEFPEAGAGKRSGCGRFPVPVHRLDMPVSGCLLLAKTPEAAAFLGEAFARPAAGNGPEYARTAGNGLGKIEKRYWAIVEKSPAAAALPQAGELVHWISFDPVKNKSIAHNEAKSGRKKAMLRYRLIGQGERYLFFEIDLVTGRHHQIRAQLAALGLHVKGDLKYGARRSEKGGGIRLHAYSLTFPNPLDSGEIIRVKALPPSASLQGPDPLWTIFADAAALCATTPELD